MRWTTYNRLMDKLIAYAKGQHSAAAAYREVYPNSSAAAAETHGPRLVGNGQVAQRIRELQKVAADTVGPTIERIVKDLERIAFSDIGQAVEWHSRLVTEKDQPDCGDMVIKHIFSNHVRIKGSDEIGPDVRAAIQSIEQTATGGLKIKFHDKLAALKLLLLAFTLITDRLKEEGRHMTQRGAISRRRFVQATAASSLALS
jgi:hypothetical protein